MFRDLIQLEKPVFAFAVDANAIYVLSGNDVVKLAKKRQCTTERHTDFFTRDGLCRALLVDDRFLYCKDFCTFYFIDKNTLQCTRRLQLGTDLRSDICGFVSDETAVYVCIRNGDIIMIDKNGGSTESRRLSDTSIWDIKAHGAYLYAGNVEGQLLVINRDTLKIARVVESHKQNLKSVYVDDQRVVTASQDKTIEIRDTGTLELLSRIRNAHKKAFVIAGEWSGYLFSVSFPCGELKVWRSDSSNPPKTIHTPASLSGDVVIDEDRLYLAARGTQAIVFAGIPLLAA